MTPITDPNLIAQLEGSPSLSGTSTPVTDPNLIAQLEGNTQTAPSLGSQILSYANRGSGDVLAGLGNAGQGIHNAPYNIANAISPTVARYMPQPTNINFNQMLGINNPNIADKLIQGTAQYAPYAALGGAALGTQIGAGGLYGMTQSSTPGQSSLIGAGSALAGGVAAKTIGAGTGMLLGTKNAQNMLGNIILKHLNGASDNGSALSPQETAENLATNYTTQNGNQLPVDIGTATNSPVLKGIYQGLKYVPFSGVSKNMNLLQKQLSDKDIANVQQQLTNESASPVVSNLNDQINQLRTQQAPYTAAINGVPDFLNNLAAGVNNRANITQQLTGDTRALYRTNKAASDEDYAPINQSNIRLDKLGIDNLFPNYSSAANALLANKENLSNLFGDDKDLGTMLNGEVNKAQNILNNNQSVGMTLQEGVQRIQNLGRLAASATGQGNRNEGRLLGNLQNALSTDVNNALNNSGNSDLAQQLQTANENFKNNVVPFWQNPEIRKSVTDSNYISPQAKLATALHNPNNQSILNQLPNNTQNAALYQLLTRGKGTSSGMANMDAPAIAKAYANIPVDAKTQISSYNPQADTYFENLPKMLNTNANIEIAKTSLGRQLQGAASIQQKNLGNLQSQLENLKNQRFGKNGENSALGQNLAHGAEAGGAALLAHYVSPYALATLPAISLSARTVAKTMNNPDLLKAYMSGTKLPVKNSINNPLLNRLLPGIGAQQSVNMLGGQ